MAAKTVATAEETRAETGNIIRLEHGCPNCGKPWEEPDPNPLCVIWVQIPGKGKIGLELCSDCIFKPRRMNPGAIVATLRDLSEHNK